MKNRLSIFVLSFLIICLIPMQLFALDQKVDSDVGPMWVSIIDFANTFHISPSGEATVNTKLYAESNINKVILTASIQQYKNGAWNTVKSWTSTSYSSNGTIDQNWYLVSGYNYRLISSGSVYQNNTLIEKTSYISSSVWY